MEVKIKKLRDVKTPTNGTTGAAAFDFYAAKSGRAVPGEVTKTPLGIAIEVPEGHALIICGRSGLGAKFGASVAQGFGLIDSDYRGEVWMMFTTEHAFDWVAGDRICQGFIVPVPDIQLVEVDELSETERGHGGLGSTGV